MLRPGLHILTSLMLLLGSLAMAADEYVSPAAVPGAITIDTTKAKALFDQGVVFIDVRNDADWESGRIPGAIHLELKHVFSAASLNAVVAKDQAVIMYCNGTQCPRSSEAAAKAVAWGFTRVYYYRLGFPNWQATGYPVE
jgi:rhodanese-related sulfurtransferase